MSAISKLMDEELIMLGFQPADKPGVIYRLCEMIARKYKSGDPKTLLDTIMNRESLQSTALGHGIAIPHARCDLSESIVIAAGALEKPIEFNSIDGKPVNLIFLIVSPKGETSNYLQTLSQIAGLLNIPAVRQELGAARTPAQFIEVIKKYERR